ncbi:MAG: iron ABC transporter permease [Lentisphaerae bacterium]|nr:iron ABC transporter permease [Lentisphaerota bacterium]
MKTHTRWGLVLLIQVVVLGAIAALGICLGSTRVPLRAVLAAMGGHASEIDQSIILGIRIPRVALAFAVGGGLSLAGVLLQGMFRNPLVEPFTLGISGGAALGLCACVAFGVGSGLGALAFPAAGFVGAMATAVLVYGLGTRRGMLNIRDVVLVGVMVSFVCSSLVMLVMALARAEDLYGIVFWTMGSLEEPRRGLLAVALGVSVVALAAAYRLAVPLNALALGEDGAAHLGIDVERTKRLLFVLSALLTGVCVSVAGIIGFVGLVVPHVARLLVGRDHRILLVSAFLCGAGFLMLCDLVARTIVAPLELPIGVVTGIAGGTLFVYMLHRRQSPEGRL